MAASLQVSRQVARVLGFEGAGKAELTVRLVGPAAVEAPKPRTETKPVPMPVLASLTMKPVQPVELLGGDELAFPHYLFGQVGVAVFDHSNPRSC